MFRTHGRVQIGGFLARAGATALYEELRTSSEWRLTANKGEEIHHFDPAELARWTPEQHAALNRAVALGGRFGFQFRYEVIRMDKTAAKLLTGFRDFMSSPEVVALMRAITGAADIAFADAHASRYHPGHFLTAHDDGAEQMNRRAAYVMNLTPQWRPDWGGLLQFYDAHGNVTRAFTPAFNVLNLFAVPQHHSVTWVTPLAAAPRYAVTGWLRASPDSKLSGM